MPWNRRKMMIFGVSLSVGFRLQPVPEALRHPPRTAQSLLTSGLLPAAGLSIFLNLVLPEEI